MWKINRVNIRHLLFGVSPLCTRIKVIRSLIYRVECIALIRLLVHEKLIFWLEVGAQMEKISVYAEHETYI